MRVAIRADASAEIGGGHIMRCLSLALPLRDAGARVEFITREHLQDMSGHLIRAGFTVHKLPRAARMSGSTSTGYDGWLGVSWEVDLRQVREVLASSGERPEWLIVDHYGVAARWENGARECSRGLLVIDDLANREHFCDILVDHNLYPELEHRYSGLVPRSCRQLLGPQFALLRPEFRAARLLRQPNDGSIRRILVSFGVSDPQAMTLRALQAIEQAFPQGIEVDTVIGPLSSSRQAIRQLCARHEGWVVHEGTERMAELMVRAHLGIGGGGTTTWERCGLGLPSLIVALSDNQIAIAEAVHAAGAALYLGRAESVKGSDIAAALSRALSNAGSVQRLSAKASELVDCLGATRVLAALHETVQAL